MAIASASDVADVADVVAANHQVVFLNLFFWERLDLEGIRAEQRDRVMKLVRQSWARSGRAGVPLGGVGAGAG